MNWFRYLHIPEVLLIAFLTALIQFPLLLTRFLVIFHGINYLQIEFVFFFKKKKNRVSSSELLSNLFIQCSEGDPYHLCKYVFHIVVLSFFRLFFF